MNDEVIPLLKVHEYFRGASDETLEEVARLGRLAHYAAGSVVHEADVVLTTVGFVLRGRLKAVRVGNDGTESLFRMIERGEQFGLMVGALDESVPIRVVALEPTTILKLDYEEALELGFAKPELRRLWLKTYAGSLRKFFFGTAPKRSAMMLALIHDSPATRPMAERLIARLADLGEKVGVLSDSDGRLDSPNVRFRPLREDGRDLTLEEIREQVSRWEDANRIIFDVHTFLTPERAAQLMELVDHAVYFFPANAADAAIRRLRAIDVTARGWRDKTRVAWMLQGDSPVVPAVPNLADLACRDFKIHEAPPGLPWGRSLANGLERLVHDLRGVRVGLALGGGAARGLAHLGALKALERSGIVVDMIAGTSAGAMTGIMYSAGLDPDYNAEAFARDLLPSWIFRQLPQGTYWHLVYKYRTRAIRPDAAEVPARLEARATRHPLFLRHGRPGERQLDRPRARRCRPRDPREHQRARALRADRPRRPGADRRRAGQQHPGECAGVDGLQFRDRRQRVGEARDALLRHPSREADAVPGRSRASSRRSCAACSFRTTT